MENLIADLRYAARTLVKTPAFLLVSVLTLALGIGGNIAIFTLVQTVLLQPLPFPQPERLVRIFDNRAGARDVGMSAIDPIAPVLLSQKGSLFLTRPILFHYIERRDALEASANELFNVVASGKVRINVNQRFALKKAAEARKTFEARATSASTILTI